MGSTAFSRELATKQAFGVPFERTSKDKSAASELANRTLVLPPHKPWTMPVELTWSEDPFREPNWVAQFHMLRWLDPLRRQAEAGKAHYIDVWLAIVESWIRHNPPGRGKARYAWADMVEAARALTFCFALPVLEDLRPDRLDTVLTAIEQHGEWLANPAKIRRGNHALQQHQGLLVIGAVLERPEWVQLATERAAQMLRESYDEQGINEEGAVQYHQINFSWWRTLKKRLEIIRGAAPEEFERIAHAPVGMAHATRPDGRYELIGDTEEFSPRGLDHPAIDYVSSAGAEGTAPKDTVKVYDAGYIFGRSSWGTPQTPFPETAFYSLRFGPQDRIHGHADGMALTLYADGAPLLVDSGKYAYDAEDPYRAYLLGRHAHNSLSVRDREYEKSAVVRLTRHQSAHGVDHYRFEDSGYPGVALSRDVMVGMEWGLILIVDQFTSQQDVTVSQWWHLDPAAGHRREDDSVFAKGQQNSLRIAWPNDPLRVTRVTRGTKTPIQGWFSPRWRTLVPTRVVEAALTGRTGTLLTVLSYQDSVQPHTVHESVDQNGQRSVHIRRGPNESFLATLSTEGATLSPHPVI